MTDERAPDMDAEAALSMFAEYDREQEEEAEARSCEAEAARREPPCGRASPE